MINGVNLGSLESAVRILGESSVIKQQDQSSLYTFQNYNISFDEASKEWREIFSF